MRRMQAPTVKTPVDDLLRLGIYHRLVLARFPEHKRLTVRCEKAEKQLEEQQKKYAEAVRALIQPRAAVKIVDFFTDRYVNMIHLAAKLADGGREGAVTRSLFPDGKAGIVEPVGASEITEVVHLETRLEKHGGPLSAEHLEPLRKLRKEYEAAVAARLAAMKEAGAQRELRNAARRVYVEAYVANQGAIKEAYPNDRRMQDLFFDDVREARDAGGDEEQTPVPAANG